MTCYLFIISTTNEAALSRANLPNCCSSLSTLIFLFCTWLKIERGHKFKCTSKCGCVFSTKLQIIILRWKILPRFTPSCITLKVADPYYLTSSHLESGSCQIPTLLKNSHLFSLLSELVNSFLPHFHILGYFTLTYHFSVYFYVFHLAPIQPIKLK